MLTAKDLIWGIIAPAVLAAVAMVLAHLPRRKQRGVQPWGPAVAIGVGFAIAFVAVRGWPRALPLSGDGSLLLTGLGAVIVSALATFMGKRWRIVIWTLSVALLAVTAWFVIKPRVHSLSIRHFYEAIVLVAVGMTVWWIAMESLASRVSGATIPFILTLTAITGSLAITNGGSQQLGQLAGAVGVTLGVITVLCLWLRGATLTHGGILVVAILLLGLLICQQFYELPLSHLVLIAIAPLVTWVGELKAFRSRPMARFSARTVALLVVLAIPLVPAIKGLKKTMTDQTESYQY